MAILFVLIPMSVFSGIWSCPIVNRPLEIVSDLLVPSNEAQKGTSALATRQLFSSPAKNSLMKFILIQNPKESLPRNDQRMLQSEKKNIAATLSFV